MGKKTGDTNVGWKSPRTAEAIVGGGGYYIVTGPDGHRKVNADGQVLVKKAETNHYNRKH